MVKQHLPEIADALYFGHAGNQGDAVRWGRALGARCDGHERLPGPRLGRHAARHPDHLGADDRRRHPGQRARRALLQRARRLLRACLPVLRQPGGVAWCVYDERLHQLGMTFPDYRDAHAAGAVRRNFALPRLDETLDSCGALSRRASKDPFGRDFTSKPSSCRPTTP